MLTVVPIVTQMTSFGLTGTCLKSPRMAVPIPEVTSAEVVVLCHASIGSSTVEALLISTASVFVPTWSAGSVGSRAIQPYLLHRSLSSESA